MIEAAPGPTEEGVVFPCHDAWLVGVLHRSASPAARGVLLVVGGPQTRVGSHRQFTLLARALAAAGVPVMRFDYRGMGDSGGTLVGFEGIAPDLDAALACFVERVTELREVVLWGLCDAASAALLHAPAHPAVAGMVLLNPWVTEGQAGAAVLLRHYYLRRALSGDFWRRLARGQVRVLPAARSLARTVLGRRPAAGSGPAPAPADAAQEVVAGPAAVLATSAAAPAMARS